jgi:HSP20 family molecular chaperone IbpA
VYASNYVLGMGTEQPRHEEVVESTADTERTMQPQRVPVNVYESAGALVIVAPFPAVTASDVTVELYPGRVRFWARLRSAGPREYLIHEWEYGGYEREIDVPSGYGGAVEASVTNGQLVVRVLRGETTDTVAVKPTGG